jgi:RNA polymerase sigma-70 factor (ECF subfamily)
VSAMAADGRLMEDGVSGGSEAGDSSRLSAEDRFHEFFQAEFPRLAGYCAGLLRDQNAAADIAQEALVRTYARWVSVREPHAYAYLVATNLVRRAWRNDASWREAASTLGREQHERLTQSAPDTGIRDMVDRLPERLRAPVLLHYYADLPIEQVALLLRRPAGTIRRHLHDARARLAEQLTEDVS